MGKKSPEAAAPSFGDVVIANAISELSSQSQCVKYTVHFSGVCIKISYYRKLSLVSITLVKLRDLLVKYR